MRAGGHIRASDADRERIAERLRRAAAEGRLLTHELEERLAATLRARTYAELDALVGDLPDGLAPARRPGQAPSWVRPAVALAIAIPLALLAVAAVLFVLTGFVMAWLPWMIVAWWLLGRPRRRRRALAGQRGAGGGGPWPLHGPDSW